MKVGVPTYRRARSCFAVPQARFPRERPKSVTFALKLPSTRTLSDLMSAWMNGGVDSWRNRMPRLTSAIKLSWSSTSRTTARFRSTSRRLPLAMYSITSLGVPSVTTPMMVTTLGCRIRHSIWISRASWPFHRLSLAVSVMSCAVDSLESSPRPRGPNPDALLSSSHPTREESSAKGSDRSRTNSSSRVPRPPARCDQWCSWKTLTATVVPL
mmetsp:Transcript_47590/g.126181  ORF Transcript_47590/g.126181 Transcript_47590/m.126181 type:complete len:212 (-) Transcript_47590:1303-1938(-)